MVGVPALAMWTWGPSSRICWPMLFLTSQRISTGVESTATHRATPPEVMSEITEPRLPAAAATARARLDPVVEGHRPVAEHLGGLVPLAGHEHHIARPGPGDGYADGPGRSGSTTSSAGAVMPARISPDDGSRVLGSSGCPRSAPPRRPRGRPPPPSRGACPGHGRRRSRTGRAPGRARPVPAPPSRATRARPGCGRSRPARRMGRPEPPPPSGPGPAQGRPAPRPRAPARPRGLVATAAATRALSTLNAPDKGRLTCRPRHSKRDRPTERVT